MKIWALAFVAACHGGGDKPVAKKRGSGAIAEVVNAPQFPDAGGRASGTTTDEVEPNDSAETATPFPMESTIRGKIDPDADIDYYRLDIEKPGALSLLTNAVDADLVVELEDSNGALIARSARGGARVKEGVPNFGVTPGRYTVLVKGGVKKKPPVVKGKKAPPPAPPGPPPVYELTSALVAIPANMEHEPDEDRGNPNDLIIGDTGSGFIGWSNDVDVWKLSVETLSAKNVIDLEIGAVEGVALELEVADGAGNVVLDRKAPRGSPLVVRGFLPNVPANSSPYHYLTIKGAGSNPETPYTVKVTAALPQTDAEMEPNDTVDKPFAMPADRTIVHGRWTAGDVDCYAIAGQGTVTATVDPSGDLDPVIELFVDGKSVAVANKAKKGAAEKVSGTAGSKTVVCVKSADTSATGEAAYDLTVQDDGL
ncbi:MAG: hypothetical protein QM831_45675 [Kofleriaceae bacterium]